MCTCLHACVCRGDYYCRPLAIGQAFALINHSNIKVMQNLAQRVSCSVKMQIVYISRLCCVLMLHTCAYFQFLYYLQITWDPPNGPFGIRVYVQTVVECIVSHLCSYAVRIPVCVYSLQCCDVCMYAFTIASVVTHTHAARLRLFLCLYMYLNACISKV